MYKKISQSKEILERLETIPTSDKEYSEMVNRMNKYMEEVHQDYLVKSRNVGPYAVLI
jgi:hypothetical protein